MLKGRREVQGQAREEWCVYLSSWLPIYWVPTSPPPTALRQPLWISRDETLFVASPNPLAIGVAPRCPIAAASPHLPAVTCRFAVNSDDEMEDEVASDDASERQLHGQQLGTTSTCMRTLPSSRAASMCERQVRG